MKMSWRERERRKNTFKWGERNIEGWREGKNKRETEM